MILNLFNRKCNKNHCTCWFDKFKKWDWAECCKKHDAQYINRKYHTKTKWQVDKEFYYCISSKTCKLYGAIMWLGQNLFSWYYWRMYK
jgi:hypothetical protein